MANGTSESGTEEFSSLLDEIYTTAKVKDDIKRQFIMIRLSGNAKERYGIEAEAYLELHKKYQEGVRHFVDVRGLGNIVYKGLISASALAAAIGTLNIFSFVADQRGKSIAASWNTLKQYRGESIDGGRKSAIESLMGFGQVLYNVDLSKAPLIRLDVRPSCALLGIMPSGTFGINWRQKNLSDKKTECSRAELQKANFNGAWMYEANMGRANLSEAKFNKDANGEAVRAQGINLSYADLSRAELIGANLSPSKNQHSDLTGADLSGANLSGANLRGVKLCRTKVRITGKAEDRTIGYEPLKSMRAECRDSAGRAIDGTPLLLY